MAFSAALNALLMPSSRSLTALRIGPQAYFLSKNKRPKKSNIKKPIKYQDVFGNTIVELAKKNKKIMGITPAMPSGSSLKFMMEKIYHLITKSLT